jgi:hypothetical protein
MKVRLLFSIGILLARIERIRLVASAGALLLYAYIRSLALIMAPSMRRSLRGGVAS